MNQINLQRKYGSIVFQVWEELSKLEQGRLDKIQQSFLGFAQKSQEVYGLCDDTQ